MCISHAQYNPHCTFLIHKRAYLLHMSSASLCMLHTEYHEDCAYLMHNITLTAHISMHNSKVSLCTSHLVCRRGQLKPFAGYLPTHWGSSSQETLQSQDTSRNSRIFSSNRYSIPSQDAYPIVGNLVTRRQSHHRIPSQPQGSIRTFLSQVTSPICQSTDTPITGYLPNRRADFQSILVFDPFTGYLPYGWGPS